MIKNGFATKYGLSAFNPVLRRLFMTNDQFYYSEHPDVTSDPITWEYTLLGHNFVFTSDNGVFSKHRVDYGSRVLLENFRTSQLPAGKILDMGTGYGPIGLAIAKILPERTIDMVDVNEIALALAKKNAVANRVKNVSIFSSNVYEAVEGNYAAVVTNPPVRAGKKVVDAMITGALPHLVAGGTLTVVLQKKQGAPSAKKLMTQLFGNCQILKRDKGYYILESTKTGAA
ncbi:methyltransferase small domain protein [Lentilactobacillus parafarraginis DSM 18390 = JCM 14109]|uniref:Methyltransferase small domain protein n=2 Tax=Lentilactobacillus parafarraginis TaxID=390842 RepID=A0A0R1YS07_9LACO|nr:methyltransferase small domain protein [Lentilactobacillus parafarraginis DSM 18390 = JCM 14109]